MAPPADPLRKSGQTSALTGLVSEAGGMRRTFVDATGTSVPSVRAVRRLVAGDEAVAALLLEAGAVVVGCAGTVDGIDPVGPQRAPDPAAVAALRPDAIVVGATDRMPDLVDARLVAALRRIAPVIAVDLGRPTVAARDVRALLGGATDIRQAPPPPGAELPPWLRRVPAPTGRPPAAPPAR
jgi:ABC-type Fe3+-hydroxamate transport system substrate-binding protein